MGGGLKVGESSSASRLLRSISEEHDEHEQHNSSESSQSTRPKGKSSEFLGIYYYYLFTGDPGQCRQIALKFREKCSLRCVPLVDVFLSQES